MILRQNYITVTGGLTCGLLFILAACAERPRIQPLHANSVIVAFGDSLTAGTGVEPNESYPTVLEQILHHKVINAGVPGEVSAAGLARLPGLMNECQPTLVILCHGGNDLLQHLDHQKIKNNLAKMIQLLRRAGADVILIGVPEPKLLHATVPFYRELAREYHLPYEGKILNRILFERSLKSDEIHPNAKGYRQLAEAVAALIGRSRITE